MLDDIKKIKNQGYMILVVCLPLSWDMIYTKFFLSWINVFNQKTYAHLDSIKVRLVVSINQDYPLQYNRTKSIDDAIDEYGADYIMTLDADMTYPKDLIGLMLHGLGEEYQVKVGVYYKKAYPFVPVLGKFSDWDTDMEKLRPWMEKHGYILPSGDQCLYHRPVCHWLPNIPFEVDTGGSGCMIATTDVFSKIKRPYFDYTKEPKSKDKEYPSVGSDIWFFSQLKKAGIKVLCDPRVNCGHVMPYEVTGNDFIYGRDSEKITEEELKLRVDVREVQRTDTKKWLIQS